MAWVYYRLIEAHQKTLADVDAKWHDATRALLRANGLDDDGNPIEEARA